MSGYVIRKLSTKCGAIDFLTLQDQDEIAEMESSEWISNIDRGGLVHVTDECFQIFLSMECAIRRHLNNKERRADEIFKDMEKILSSDNSVLFDWLMIITGDEGGHKEVFLQIIKQWVHGYMRTLICKICLGAV